MLLLTSTCQLQRCQRRCSYCWSLWQSCQTRASLNNRDRDFNVELGLTFNLGKATWNKTPDVDALKALSQSQIDALNAQLADEQAENARLKKMIKNHKCPETGKTITVKEVVAAPVSVFFNIGKSKIASQKDLVNVEQAC